MKLDTVNGLGKDTTALRGMFKAMIGSVIIGRSKREPGSALAHQGPVMRNPVSVPDSGEIVGDVAAAFVEDLAAGIEPFVVDDKALAGDLIRKKHEKRSCKAIFGMIFTFETKF
jgi:hypothetical protein